MLTIIKFELDSCDFVRLYLFSPVYGNGMIHNLYLILNGLTTDLTNIVLIRNSYIYKSAISTDENAN